MSEIKVPRINSSVLVRALFMVCRQTTAFLLSSKCLFSVLAWRVCSLVSLLIRTLILLDQNPALMISFNLYYLLLDLIYKCS